MPSSGGDRWFNAPHEISKKKHAGTYLDPSDVKALTQQAVIDFYHESTKNSIAFKAFITGYSDSYQINYAAEPAENLKLLYGGQLDKPKTTTRTITLSWKTVAASQAEAEENMRRVSELTQMLYSSLSKSTEKSSGDGKAGEVKVRFAQWLVNPSKVDPESPGQFAPADSTGLDCRMSTMSYEPDLEQGSFDGPTGIFPKVININCTLLHQPKVQKDDGSSSRATLRRNFRGNTTLNKKQKKSHQQLVRTPFGYKGLDGGKSSPPPTVSEIGEKSDDDYDAFIEESLTRGGG